VISYLTAIVCFLALHWWSRRCGFRAGFRAGKIAGLQEAQRLIDTIRPREPCGVALEVCRE